MAREGVLPRQLEAAMNGHKTGTLQLLGSLWVGVAAPLSAVFWEKNAWPYLILRAICGPQEVPGPYNGIQEVSEVLVAGKSHQGSAWLLGSHALEGCRRLSQAPSKQGFGQASPGGDMLQRPSWGMWPDGQEGHGRELPEPRDNSLSPTYPSAHRAPTLQWAPGIAMVMEVIISSNVTSFKKEVWGVLFETPFTKVSFGTEAVESLLQLRRKSETLIFY